MERRVTTLPDPARSASAVLPGRLAPEAMYPAGDPAISVRFVTLPSGLRVRALECGVPTGPAVVLIHGWCCSVYGFRRNVGALAAAGFRVVLADLKGHGLSDKPLGPGEYTLASMADHVVQFLDAVGVPRAAVVGHSMGGAIAVAVALRHPERVRRLALLAPVGFGAVGLLRMAQVVTHQRFAPLLPRLIMRWQIAAVLRLAYGRARAAISPRDVEEYFAPTQFPAFVWAMRRLLHDFHWAPGDRADLERLGVPTFVMFGTRDRLVYRPSVAAMVRAIPDVVFDVVEGAGHVLPEEVPERVNARLTEFLAVGDERGDRIAAGATTG